MTAQHGILKPNPVLFELDSKWKKKPLLAHELGEGSPCQKCLDKCPGFQLHYWRKLCVNCHCSKIDHNVIEDVDPGFYFVGRIFDLPLRSKKEELQFCYGIVESSDEDEEPNAKKNVKFDWIPPNVTNKLARRYFNELPEASLPVAGSDGALLRQRNLGKQFPVHDVDPSECHELTPGELSSMQDYVKHVKDNVAGQGQIQMVVPSSPLKLPEENIEGIDESFDPDWLPPPPSEFLINPPSPSGMKPDLHHVTFRAEPFTNTASRNVIGVVPPRKLSNLSGESEQARKGQHNNDLKGYKCQHCTDKIYPGEIAIFADRAGPNKMWHPRCFVCGDCKELLVDLLYYYHDGGVFCARDYANRRQMPRCNACDELIFCAEYTGAEEKFWHMKHFCCFECDNPLGGHKYISVQGQPHCLICYQNKHGKSCLSCGEYISPEEQRISLENKHWHARDECFKCNVCETPLVKKKIAFKFGVVLCSSACVRKEAESRDISPSANSTNSFF